MGEKLKKILKLFFSNKKALLLTLGLVLFLSLAPFHFVQANIFSDIANYLLTLPIRISALFIAISIAITAVGVGISYSIVILILGWVAEIATSVLVIPAEVEVVEVGWTITQNLANMFLILILVFIGLATILRLREYEAKKLLPTLILVALLINFSPVLVGFVVDISNIVAKAFLPEKFETVITVWQMIEGYFTNIFSIMTELGGNVWSIIGHIVGVLVLGVVLIAFFVYSAWIYLLVVGLLIVRIIYLWILMILAPIAFLSKIFPAKGTPKMLFPGILHWDEWWKELVSWSIIAIPIGFFLMLSFKVLEASTKVQTLFRASVLKEKTAGAEGFFGDFVIQFQDLTSQLAHSLELMLVPLLSIIILHIGYNLSRKNMPAAAQGIISGIEKGMKMVAGTALVAATGGAAAGLAAKGLAGAATKAKGVEAALGRVPIAGKALKYGVGKPVSWVTRGMEKAATPRLLELAAEAERHPLPKNFEKWNADKQAKWTNTALLTSGQRLRASYAMGENLKYVEKINPELHEKLQKDVAKRSKEPTLQKEVDNYRKYYHQDSTEEIHTNVKMSMEVTAEGKEEAKRKAKEEIDKVAKEIKEEAKFNLELQMEIEKVMAKRGITGPEGYERAVRDIAAGEIFVEEKMKRKDMDKVADPKTIQFRRAMRNQTSSVYQGLVENFDKSTIRDIFDKAGGLNQVIKALKDKPKEQEELLKKLIKDNEALLSWFFFNPAGQNWALPDLREAVREVEKTNIKDDPHATKAYEKFAAEVRGEKPPTPPPKVPPKIPPGLYEVSEEEKRDMKAATPPKELIQEGFPKALRAKGTEIETEAETVRKQLESLKEQIRLFPKLPPEREEMRKENLARLTREFQDKEKTASILKQRAKLIEEILKEMKVKKVVAEAGVKPEVQPEVVRRILGKKRRPPEKEEKPPTGAAPTPPPEGLAPAEVISPTPPIKPSPPSREEKLGKKVRKKRRVKTPRREEEEGPRRRKPREEPPPLEEEEE